MDELTKAERTISGLERVRTELRTRRQQLLDQRRQDAYGAHAGGSDGARKRLKQAEAELAGIDAELETLAVAITEAHARLASAKAAEHTEAERARGERIAE